MKCYEKNLDEKVKPLVRYFNEVGLRTKMSCQGHNKTNMSMFWIEFDSSVTNGDIVAFQRKHLNRLGGFSCNGRFTIRILASAKGIEYAITYMAATIEAAMGDLKQWNSDDQATGIRRAA